MTFTPGKKQTPSKTKYTNPTSLEEAISVSMKIVYKQASKWTRNHYQDKDDIVQEGVMGVIEAWNRFHGSSHEEQNYRFTSYAWLWIRAYMKAYAEKNWKRMNSEDARDIGDLEIGNASYDIDERMIDISRRVDRMEEKDQNLFLMRRQGYTFAEIAESTGAQNLHKVRGRFLELCEEL